MSIVSTHLEAKARSGSGKGVSRRTRAEGLIPAIVYGKHLDKPMTISLDPKALKAAIQTPKKLNTVIGLKVDGGSELMVLLKEYQMHPVSRELLHADFIDVRENEQVKVHVPINLTGKAEGVVAGGILSQMRRDLDVWALPGKIPEKIDIDVTALKIGQSVHVKDVKFPEGITVKTMVNYTIAVVTTPEEEVVEAVVAPVEGAEGAAAAPGAAPGAPGAAGAAPGTPGAAPAAGAAAAGDKKGAAAAGDKKGAAAAPSAAGDKKAEAKPAGKK